MTALHTRVRAAMTPDHSVRFDRYAVSENSGALYVNPDSPSDAADLALACAADQREFRLLDPVAISYFGEVRRAADYAVKRTFKILSPEAYDAHGPIDLQDVRANVSLQTGLQRLATKPGMLGAVSLSEHFRYTAPTIHAAFVPDDTEATETPPTTIVMSYESGFRADEVDVPVPHPARRAAVYFQALSRCGAGIHEVDIDDNPGNTIVRPYVGGTAHEIVHFDVMAKRRFARHFGHRSIRIG